MTLGSPCLGGFISSGFAKINKGSSLPSGSMESLHGLLIEKVSVLLSTLGSIPASNGRMTRLSRDLFKEVILILTSPEKSK